MKIRAADKGFNFPYLYDGTIKRLQKKYVRRLRLMYSSSIKKENAL